MALVIATIQKEMEAAIAAALASEFSKEGAADPSSYKKTAAAIAKGVTQVLVKAIQTQAEVLPGIPAGGGPTVGPGKIF